MKIYQTKKVPYEITVGKRIKVFDYEEKVWMDGEIGNINHDNTVRIVCGDGLQWDENLVELSDPKSYKFD